MANEAILRERHEVATSFIVADGTGIEKGQILKLTDPRTAAASTAANDVIAGIAAVEKVASDGRTALAVYTTGIFDMICSGTVTLGSPVCTDAAGANHIKSVTQLSGANILGYALETGSDDEVIQVQLNIQNHAGAAD